MQNKVHDWWYNFANSLVFRDKLGEFRGFNNILLAGLRS